MADEVAGVGVVAAGDLLLDELFLFGSEGYSHGLVAAESMFSYGIAVDLRDRKGYLRIG